MNIIITMAGKSTRFIKSGFKKSKFLLPLGNRSTIISEILNNYDDNDNFHLVITEKQAKKYKYLENYLLSLKKNIHLNIIREHDKGPAYSAIQAKSCEGKRNIIISYCDFLMSWNYKKFKREIINYDFGIVSFKGFHPSSFSGTLYCYLKILNKEIINLREKKSFTDKPFLEFASTGSYYFKSFSDLKFYTQKAFKNKTLVNNFKEIYISLLFLEVLKKKKKILNFEVDNFISLGTPRDYDQYLDWKNFFETNKLSKYL
jgi:NDP-sugar pyrophosphorylase family protein